jgi:hypothetical protein
MPILRFTKIFGEIKLNSYYLLFEVFYHFESIRLGKLRHFNLDEVTT